MSNTSMESTGHKQVERAPERAASPDIARSAYGQEALADLHKNSAPNTADQHLSAATISKDQISFGASSGCSSGDLGLKVHDNMPVTSGGDAGNGLKVHDNMPVTSGSDAGNGLKIHDNMPVTSGDSDHVRKLPPGQDRCAMGQAKIPDAATTGANDSDHVKKIVPSDSRTEGQGGNSPADKNAGNNVGGTRVGETAKQPVDPYRDSGAPSGEQRPTDCSGTSFQSAHKDGHSDAPAHAPAHEHAHEHAPAHVSHSEGHSHAHAHAHASHAEGYGQAHAHHEHHQTTHEHIGSGAVGSHQSARGGSGIAGRLDEKITPCKS